MADLGKIKEHMEIIGADGVHLGTVDSVEGDRIKMTKADSGSHAGHHHFLSSALVAAVEGDQCGFQPMAHRRLCWKKRKAANRWPIGIRISYPKLSPAY